MLLGTTQSSSFLSTTTVSYSYLAFYRASHRLLSIPPKTIMIRGPPTVYRFGVPNRVFRLHVPHRVFHFRVPHRVFCYQVPHGVLCTYITGVLHKVNRFPSGSVNSHGIRCHVLFTRYSYFKVAHTLQVYFIGYSDITYRLQLYFAWCSVSRY